MDNISLLALLLVLSTLFSLVNARTLRLPMTIGVLVFSLLTSLLVMAINPFIPAYDLQLLPRSLLGQINLPQSLLNGALSLLLFAGALQVDVRVLRARLGVVAMLAVVGTVLAVFLLAGTAYVVFPLCGARVPFVWCVVMGSILAPTDPVSVVGMLRRLGLPDQVQAVFAGESLFNDGIAVLVFNIALDIAVGDRVGVSFEHVTLAFLHEAVGGVVLGAVAGWFALRCLRGPTDSHINLLASLALATGVYSLANHFGMSGPIAVVVAGMSLGTRYGRRAFDAAARAELDNAWSLIDEVLNVLLFLLIGLEAMELSPHWRAMLAMVAIVPLSVAVRGLSVWIATLPVRIADRQRTLKVLIWGGLRGGISVALALGLPAGEMRTLLLPVCYGVVVFTILVQGLTMERVTGRLYGP